MKVTLNYLLNVLHVSRINESSSRTIKHWTFRINKSNENKQWDFQINKKNEIKHWIFHINEINWEILLYSHMQWFKSLYFWDSSSNNLSAQQKSELMLVHNSKMTRKERIQMKSNMIHIPTTYIHTYYPTRLLCPY